MNRRDAQQLACVVQGSLSLWARHAQHQLSWQPAVTGNAALLQVQHK